MKYLKTLSIALILLSFISCDNNKAGQASEDKTETINGITTSTFKVWGNCEMCKETIEGSLKKDGITKADWNTETKMITITYDPAVISLDQLHKNIASVGYDTEKYKGDDNAYSELPGCCQYDRK
jgi:copper chaperone CopZ